jgi:hypothetical protein
VINFCGATQFPGTSVLTHVPLQVSKKSFSVMVFFAVAQPPIKTAAAVTEIKIKANDLIFILFLLIRNYLNYPVHLKSILQNFLHFRSKKMIGC